MSAKILSFFRPSAGLRDDWSSRELAEFYRVEAATIQAGLRVGIDRGLTDEGDPWFVFVHRDTGNVLLHIARIDGLYCLAGDDFPEVLRGTDFRGLLTELTRNHPSFLPLPRGGSDGKVLLHPVALLAAVVATAFLISKPSDAFAASADAIDAASPSDHGPGAHVALTGHDVDTYVSAHRNDDPDRRDFVANAAYVAAALALSLPLIDLEVREPILPDTSAMVTVAADRGQTVAMAIDATMVRLGARGTSEHIGLSEAPGAMSQEASALTGGAETTRSLIGIGAPLLTADSSSRVVATGLGVATTPDFGIGTIHNHEPSVAAQAPPWGTAPLASLMLDHGSVGSPSHVTSVGSGTASRASETVTEQSTTAPTRDANTTVVPSRNVVTVSDRPGSETSSRDSTSLAHAPTTGSSGSDATSALTDYRATKPAGTDVLMGSSTATSPLAITLAASTSPGKAISEAQKLVLSLSDGWSSASQIALEHAGLVFSAASVATKDATATTSLAPSLTEGGLNVLTSTTVATVPSSMVSASSSITSITNDASPSTTGTSVVTAELISSSQAASAATTNAGALPSPSGAYAVGTSPSTSTAASGSVADTVMAGRTLDATQMQLINAFIANTPHLTATLVDNTLLLYDTVPVVGSSAQITTWDLGGGGRLEIVGLSNVVHG